MLAISWQRMWHSLLVWFFFPPSSTSITFPLLIQPQKQLRNLSFHFFTGATHSFRRAVIQVFSTPLASYSSTGLHSTVSQLFQFCLNPYGTSWGLHCQAPSLEAKPSPSQPGPRAQGEECTCLKPCSTSTEQQDTSELPFLEAHCERSIKTDWITVNANRIHTTVHTKKKLKVVYHHETMKRKILDQSSCSVKRLNIWTFSLSFKNEILKSCLQLIFNQLNRIKWKHSILFPLFLSPFSLVNP